MKINFILTMILSIFLITSCKKNGEDQITIGSSSVHEFIGAPFDNFGNADGSTLVDIRPNTTHAAGTFKDVSRGMILQSDGKVLIYGDTSNTFASGPTDGFISRLNKDGTLDTSFNTTGTYIYNSSYDRRDFLFDVRIHNNYIYAFGSSRTTVDANSATSVIVRLNMNGTIDTSFGTNGVAWLSNQTSFAMRAAIASDGSMYILSYNVPGSGRQYFITKVNANGVIDTTFGASGIYAYPTGITYIEGDIVLDKNGKILTTFTAGADSNSYKTIIVRLNTDGSLDNSFATSGVFTLTYGLKNYSRNIIFYKNEIIVVVSATQDNTVWAGQLLKLDQSGTPINSWGVNGVMDYLTNSTGEQLGLMQARIYGDKIIVSGDDANNFRLSALDAQTGEIDLEFGGDGIYESDVATPSYKGSWLHIDEVAKSIWISGNAETSSANQQIHVSKFK